MVFTDTEKDFDFLDESFNFFAEVKKLKDDGFIKCPDDHAPPDNEYEYACIGFLLYYRKKTV